MQWIYHNTRFLCAFAPLRETLWRALVVMALASPPIATEAADEIKIANVLVKLLDQHDVPAREKGTIKELVVQEGSRVKTDDVLITIDDTEARYAEDRARVVAEPFGRVEGIDVLDDVTSVATGIGDHTVARRRDRGERDAEQQTVSHRHEARLGRVR